jgi:predicted DNA-binding transcriptional regulator AlpA
MPVAKVEDSVEPILITYRGAAAMTSLERTSLERLVKAGRFPQPVRISDSRLGFVASEVRQWCEARIASRDRASGASGKARAA